MGKTKEKFQPTQGGPTTMTVEEWNAEGERRFGADRMQWRFKCPSCKNIMTPQMYRDAGAPETAIAFSCVGRWMPDSKAEIWQEGKGPCNYAGGGLFRLNPITVIDKDGAEHSVFEFAEQQVPAH